MNSRLRQLAGLDRMIHEPARLMIAATLYLVKEADFLYLQNQTDLTKGNLSSHLAKLEEAGYVGVKKMFENRKPVTWFAVSTTGKTALKNHLAAMESLIKASNV